MAFNIDSAIFIGFLVVNLAVGLYFSKGTKTIREYAIGNRNFSTATIAATIVATWITGEVFFTTISETYSNGMYFIFAATGDMVGLLVIGFFFAPRMAEFLGKLSIAEAMGDLFGQHIRIITALFGCIGTAGIIAVQLKVSGLLFEYCFDISSTYGVIIGGIIITLYSSLGGIKSVTFTDVIQFFTFGTIIPSVALFILGTLDNSAAIIDTLSSNSLFNYKEVFDFNLPKSQYFLFLFVFFAAVLGVNPAIFQRISMSKNTEQVSKSFYIAAATYSLVIISMIWIGVMLLSVKPNLEPQNLVKHILFDYSFTGLKGLTLIGIMAMVMSTADSYINSTAVLFVHDLCKPIGLIKSNELASTRIVSFVVGTLALLLSLSSDNLLDLIITTNVFYLPVVIIPFTLAILGFRSSGKSVLISMIAGLCALIVGMIVKIDILQAAVLGMLANFIFLLCSHYFLKQPGGWVGIKDDSALCQVRKERRIKIQNLCRKVVSFDLATFFRSNSLKSEGMYCLFGLFCIISIYSTMHTIPEDLKLFYPATTNFIYITVLFIATILLSFPLWLESWKGSIVGAIFWNISVFYILICVGFALVIMSNFAQMQLVAFMFNLIVIAALMRWQWALLLIITGLTLTIQFFKSVEMRNLSISWDFVEFKTTYIMLFASSILIAFLKPKQEYVEATEQKADALEGEKAILDHKVASLDTQVKTLEVQKVRLTGDVTALGLQVRSVKDERAKLIHEVSNLGSHVTDLEDEKARLTDKVTDLSGQVGTLNTQVTDLNSQITGLSAEVTDLASQVGDLNEQVVHYTEQIADKDKEIDRLGQTSQRILNNVNHELRLPIGNVVNFSEMLTETLGKTENNKLMKELAKEVYDNSNRVSSMILNMLDLATLAVKKVDLEKTMVNFSELVLERVRRCQKIYKNGKNLEFELDIEPEILISVDPNYMRQTVDNLVINAINFSETGGIKVFVSKQEGQVVFTITDQGKGIPQTELADIFTPFKMGTNSESKAYGRGVGLALCKSAVEAHGGSIKAESDGECGAKLQFTLPFKNN
jgi:Na+/proline symporter/signal transduction histidine kinase